jgi:hypothetical protein
MKCALLLTATAGLCLFAQPSSQKMDEGYGKKIKEATTDPSFLTEFVDHLPLSDKVPTPEKYLGYIVGAPNRLTHVKEINGYLSELAKTSPRVKFSVVGKSEEGRDTGMVVISDEANLAKLARYKEITAKLADPRKISEADANKLIAEGLPIYWLNGSIHSTETGSPEMLMELAYRLAVEESAHIQAIRKNAIVMITPVIEVDGRDRMVDLYRYRKEFPNRPAPSLLYWGKYVAHDNNRDSMVMSLELSRIVMKTFFDFHPQVLHDLHESVPFLYISTGMGPYNAWLDPIVISEWQRLAYYEIEELTKRGLPGVWTHGFYDGWAVNYMFMAAQGHNSIGRFYETFGNGGADTRERTVPAAQTTRQWFRPNPPLPRVRWSQRNNVNYQQSGVLLGLNFVATHKEEFLRNFYIKSKRSVAKGTTEGPAAWVLPADDPRPVEVAEMLNLLKAQGVETHKLSQEIEVKTKTGTAKYPAGSYVIRMDQPYSRMADMLLDTQYYNVNDPNPYDDTGWTFGPLRNVKTNRVTDVAILKAGMTEVQGEIKVRGKVEGSGVAYIINHNADNTLASFRFAMKDVKMLAAEDAFQAGGRSFKTGSFIIPDSSGLRAKLESAAAQYGFNAFGVAEMPKVTTHPLAVPRVALVHTWVNTQDEGWYRVAFDNLKIPYTYISDHVLRDTANLRDKFDVIVFGPARGTSQRVLNGVQGREPIPWKESPLTPAMGNSPDQSDDIRGGMGLQGLVNLQKFIEAGGLFVTIGSNASIPIDFGMADGVSITPTRELRARGSVISTNFADRKSPIAYGYDEKLAVYFNQAPVFNTNPLGALGGGGGGGGLAALAGGAGGGPTRASGRGSATDPDVIQGRPYVEPPAAPRPTRPGEDPPIPEEIAEQVRASLPPPEMMPRTILRFGPENELLISGMLAGGREMANRPAIVDVPKGKGHILMFANNPMWRHETQGSYFLLFNALLNYDNLGVGRPAVPAGGPGGGRPSSTAGGEDQDQQPEEQH